MFLTEPPLIDSDSSNIAMISIHGYVSASPSLGAADTGGQVIYVLELSKKLAEQGYQVDVFTRQFENQKQIERVAQNVRIIRIPCGGDGFIPKEYMCDHCPEWARNVMQFIRQGDRSYAFINSHYWDAGLAASTLSRKLGIPHIHTPHSLGKWKLSCMRDRYDDNPEAMEEKYNFTTRISREKQIYRQAQAITTTSAVQTDILTEDYGIEAGKIHLIPPGFDQDQFYPLPSAERKLRRKQEGLGDKKVIIALGRHYGWTAVFWIAGFEKKAITKG